MLSPRPRPVRMNRAVFFCERRATDSHQPVQPVSIQEGSRSVQLWIFCNYHRVQGGCIVHSCPTRSRVMVQRFLLPRANSANPFGHDVTGR